MKILIVSATEKEVNLLIQKTGQINKISSGVYSGKWGALELEYLIAGVGLPSTVYQITRHLLASPCQLVLNAGIAGSFSPEILVGSVVNVMSECFADLGIDNKGDFQTLFEMGFIDKNTPPFISGKLINNFDSKTFSTLETLKKVNGITVHKASGEETDILKKIAKFQPDVESMEGAGIFFVCQNLSVPFLEIRAISNVVEARNPKNWNIPLALINLSNSISNILSEIESK